MFQFVPATAPAPNVASEEPPDRAAWALQTCKLEFPHYLEIQARKTPFNRTSSGSVLCGAWNAISEHLLSSTGEPLRMKLLLLNFHFYLNNWTHILFSPLCFSSQRPLLRENIPLRAALQHALHFQHMLKLPYPPTRVRLERRAQGFCRVGFGFRGFAELDLVSGLEKSWIWFLFSHCSRWPLSAQRGATAFRCQHPPLCLPPILLPVQCV